jgi:hypothetical protein
MTPPALPQSLSRRAFAQAGATLATAAASLAVATPHSSTAAAEETRTLRLGIIGCGGRGTGAINNSLSINEGVTLVAAADINGRNCAKLWKMVRETHPDKVAADETSHVGLDGYKRILDDPAIDVVIITSPPGFHPGHVRAAVAAGKHVFLEKPACVDPAGYRSCLEAHDAAVAKGTAIVGGTQYRRQANYIGAIDQIREGAIGDVIGATARYRTTGIWYRPRTAGISDAEYQLNPGSSSAPPWQGRVRAEQARLLLLVIRSARPIACRRNDQLAQIALRAAPPLLSLPAVDLP